MQYRLRCPSSSLDILFDSADELGEGLDHLLSDSDIGWEDLVVQIKSGKNWVFLTKTWWRVSWAWVSGLPREVQDFHSSAEAAVCHHQHPDSKVFVMLFNDDTDRAITGCWGL